MSSREATDWTSEAERQRVAALAESSPADDNARDELRKLSGELATYALDVGMSGDDLYRVAVAGLVIERRMAAISEWADRNGVHSCQAQNQFL